MSKVSLFSVTGNCVFVYECLDTWISSEFNSWRCEVNGNLFCMSATDSCSGPLARSAATPHLLAKNPAGRRDSQPTGKPAGNVATNGAEWKRLYAWPGLAWPRAVCRLRVCIVRALRHLLSPKSHLQEVTAAGCLSAELKSCSRGVGRLQALG